MAQIPIEAVIKTHNWTKWSYVALPPMSEKAARKFCKQMGWVFKKSADGNTFLGKSILGENLLIAVEKNSVFFSR